MGHYTMLYEYGKSTRDSFGTFFIFYLVLFAIFWGGVFNRTIIPLALVGYEMVIASSISCPMRARGTIVNFLFP